MHFTFLVSNRHLLKDLAPRMTGLCPLPLLRTVPLADRLYLIHRDTEAPRTLRISLHISERYCKFRRSTVGAGYPRYHKLFKAPSRSFLVRLVSRGLSRSLAACSQGLVAESARFPVPCLLAPSYRMPAQVWQDERTLMARLMTRARTRQAKTAVTPPGASGESLRTKMVRMRIQVAQNDLNHTPIITTSMFPPDIMMLARLTVIAIIIITITITPLKTRRHPQEIRLSRMPNIQRQGCPRPGRLQRTTR